MHRITPAVNPSYSSIFCQPCWSEDVAHVHDHSLLPVLLRGICWRETLSLRGSVVPAIFTSSRIRDTPFQSNTKCDVIIRKYLSPNDVLSSGAHDEGHDGVSSIHAEDHGGCSTRRKHHHCWCQAITHARKADDRAPSLKLGFFVLAAHFQVRPMIKSES